MTQARTPDPAVQKAASHVCRPAFRKYVGGGWRDRLLARFNLTYYLPDDARVSSATNWVRCDPTTWSYGWRWPTRSDWTTGQRFGFCWAQDSG